MNMNMDRNYLKENIIYVARPALVKIMFIVIF